MPRPSRPLLVTGTDTGVGKTFVGCALGRALVARGLEVVAIKPVESGCDRGPEREQDGVLLAAATGQAAPRHALVRLGGAVAPPMAADAEGVELNPAAWVQAVRELGTGADVVLVEGAGGLLSPLAPGFDGRDLGRELGARVLLVAADRLGALNHSLLTVEALAAAALPLCGVVVSAPGTADGSTGHNGEQLRRQLQVPVLTLPRAEPSTASTTMAPVVGWILG